MEIVTSAGGLARERPPQGEDQLAPRDVRPTDQRVAVAGRDRLEARARVVRDVLVLVAAGGEEPVERLDDPPPDGGTIRGADDDEPARPQGPA
jgi:hypothetical protein